MGGAEGGGPPVGARPEAETKAMILHPGRGDALPEQLAEGDSAAAGTTQQQLAVIFEGGAAAVADRIADALAFGQEGVPCANTHDPAHEAPGAERLQGRGRDESTVNMRAFLASEDHRLVYNELRGICNKYVQEAHRQLRISSPGYIARHKALIMADPDCGSGPAHVDGVAGGCSSSSFSISASHSLPSGGGEM
eukprot:jgi/Tetstr1/445687/TSEL_003491.t1